MNLNGSCVRFLFWIFLVCQDSNDAMRVAALVSVGRESRYFHVDCSIDLSGANSP